MGKTKALFEIIRPVNVVITFVTVVLAGYFCSGQNIVPNSIFWAAMSASLIAAAGNLVNDYFDLDADKINRPNRILPSGKLSTKAVLFFYLLLTSIGFILSFFINSFAVLIAGAAVILVFLYSLKLKSIPLLGNIAVSILTGLVFIYGGVATNNVSNAVIPALFGFLVNVIREIIKDIEDIPGDKQVGVTTFPSKYGIDNAFLLARIFTIILIVSTFIPFIFNLYKIEYFVVVMTFVNTLLVYTYKYMNSSHLDKLRRSSNMIKLTMIFGLIAIFLGK